MPVISFLKKKDPLTVPQGANLMQVLLQNDIPVASSCNGDGVCAKCKLKIHAGLENLTPETDLEKFLKEKNHMDKDMRLSCQAQVLGPITVDASYW